MSILRAVVLLLVCILTQPSSTGAIRVDELTEDQLNAVLQLEKQRVKAIDRVIGSVVAIYGMDRSGGGSGVIIHPSGIALTNHHVIMGAGVEGWGGISDGKMYKWKLIGTDPGGDVSIIQMEGRDSFPWTPLGDSDTVRVGDWALAMGNPFILSEDQSPTVTLGIVSGVKRYQPGAGQNQLEYGNCIQVDSSINPGNSGGPLFNFRGEVIGINGRGSFQDRGRVNVGLGYAISSNQIRNFIPELLATKLVEHATLDANFSNRNGKVVCSDLNRDAPVAVAGLELGDELLEFEGEEIRTANQFTNLICTIPEDWPVSLKVRDKKGKVKDIHVRAYGLPYSKPKKNRNPKADKDKTPEEKAQEQQQNAMIKLLSAPPGEIRHRDINQKYASLVLNEWRKRHAPSDLKTGFWKIKSTLSKVTETKKDTYGDELITLFHDGRFILESSGESPAKFLFDGQNFFIENEEQFEILTAVEAKTSCPLMAAFGIAAPLRETALDSLGQTMIDGSDRTMDAVSWRFQIEDADEDPTFVWIEVNRAYGEFETAKMLRKIASSRDCSGEGGVVFEDFEMDHGLAVPRTRNFINGLNENVTGQLVVKDIKWVEGSFDESIFEGIEAPKTKVSDAVSSDADSSEEVETTKEEK